MASRSSGVKVATEVSMFMADLARSGRLSLGCAPQDGKIGPKRKEERFADVAAHRVRSWAALANQVAENAEIAMTP
jgi:hypothetical protein